MNKALFTAYIAAEEMVSKITINESMTEDQKRKLLKIIHYVDFVDGIYAAIGAEFKLMAAYYEDHGSIDDYECDEDTEEHCDMY